MHTLCIYQYKVTQTFVAIFFGGREEWEVVWQGRDTRTWLQICLYIEIVVTFHHHYTFKDFGHTDHSSLNITVQKSLSGCCVFLFPSSRYVAMASASLILSILWTYCIHLLL
jgi:hypothetical protein